MTVTLSIKLGLKKKIKIKKKTMPEQNWKHTNI